jgi:hypothetical protein
VFKLRSPGETEATRIVELAVTHEGLLRGSHFDRVDNQVEEVRGQIDRQTMRAVWTVGPPGGVTFEATVEELSKPVGVVTVRLGDGSTAVWQMEQVKR